MKPYLLAIDQGTTSSRAIVFDQSGSVLTSSQREFTQYTPREAWVEHDALEIWESQLAVVRDALASVDGGAGSIAAVGITNQRETTILWDKRTGKPVGHAVVWQCRRSSDICKNLTEAGHADFIKKTTGLVIDPYFSGTKIRWLLDDNPDLEAAAKRGDILFGTVDTWLLWKLTGGKVHATDYTNASRTMLMNLSSGEWDEDMLRLLDIPKAILPEIRPSVGDFGSCEAEFFGHPLPIRGIAGDQHAALFGHKAFNAGDVKNTYGTGCFMLMNVGREPVVSEAGLLSTVAWGIDNEITYALEGSVFMAGALLQWLRDDLELVRDVYEVNRMAEETEDNGGVYLVPSFQGLGAPWWSSNTRGALVGLTRAAKKRHICRAFIESIAYRSRDVIEAMVTDSGRSLGHMRVDGGATRSDVLMAFQADILGIPVERPASVEITALGAALMAGLGIGLWGKIEELEGLSREQTLFQPAMESSRREELYSNWIAAVQRQIMDTKQ